MNTSLPLTPSEFYAALGRSHHRCKTLTRPPSVGAARQGEQPITKRIFIDFSHGALAAQQAKGTSGQTLKRAAVPPDPAPLQIVAPPVRRWAFLYDWARNRTTMLMLGGFMAACLLLWCGGVPTAARSLLAQWRNPADPPAWQQLTADEWFTRARERVRERNFGRALGTVNYALEQLPEDVELLDFKGDMFESVFHFQDAQTTYQRVLQFKAGDRHARENLTLCLRLNRHRFAPESHPSTLYALHRMMLEEGRVSEAAAICERLPSDRALRQATWQTALDETGLRGTITVDQAGKMALDLAGVARPDLSLIRTFPLSSLDLANTALDDIGALRGLRLEKLDLSQTNVYDLSPLRGMPLRVLRIPGTQVIDLAPLAGCPLRELDVSRTGANDLSALAEMPLVILRAANTPVTDLRSLATVPLTELDLAHTRVSDLRPLRYLGLQVLRLDGTGVRDLSPLRGGHLRELTLATTAVSDLAPLAGMPLEALDLAGCARVVDLRPLATCLELEHLNAPPLAQSLNALANLPRLHFVRRDEAHP